MSYYSKSKCLNTIVLYAIFEYLEHFFSIISLETIPSTSRLITFRNHLLRIIKYSHSQINREWLWPSPQVKHKYLFTTGKQNNVHTARASSTQALRSAKWSCQTGEVTRPLHTYLLFHFWYNWWKMYGEVGKAHTTPHHTITVHNPVIVTRRAQ